MDLRSLLKGTYDLHVHSGPDVMARRFDDLEMTARLASTGMKGYVIKSHYFCTSARAKLVNKLYPDVNVIGSVSLNNAVGGLNPMAVEMAARDGAKLIWMPTVDAQHEQNQMTVHKAESMPHWAKIQLELIAKGARGLSVLDDGRLKKEVLGILDIIAEYNLILATGHLSPAEIRLLIKEAFARKVKKVIITHVNFPTTKLPKETQKEFADMGAYIEYNYRSPASGKSTWEEIYESIRYVGPRQCVLSTDLGQPEDVYPDEGLYIIMQKLAEHGYSEDELRIMVHDNPVYLVEG